MRGLLDVNVLIAIFDELHQHHTLAKEWLMDNIHLGWASCPITQNGFIRILSQPAYPRPVPITQTLSLLEEATQTEHHEFWADEISMTDKGLINRTRIHGSKQVTDAYLLALAVKHEGCLVTFDGRIPVSSVQGATKNHLCIL